MSDKFSPWARFPELSKERLVVLGNLFRNVRQEVAGLHDREAGDSLWSMHCRGYSRTCHAITETAKQESWLKVINGDDGGLQFDFAIGEVPVRFYRGTENDPPPLKYRRRSSAESYHCQGLLGFADIVLEGALRFVVETDFFGYPLAVYLVELDSDGVVINSYTIPESESGEEVPPIPITPIPVLAPAAAIGVELPPVPLEELEDDEDDRREDAGRIQ